MNVLLSQFFILVSIFLLCGCYAKIRAHLAVLKWTRNMYSILRMEYINKVFIFSWKKWGERERERGMNWHEHVDVRNEECGHIWYQMKWALRRFSFTTEASFYHTLCSDFISFPHSISDEISFASSCWWFFFCIFPPTSNVTHFIYSWMRETCSKWYNKIYMSIYVWKCRWKMMYECACWKSKNG